MIKSDTLDMLWFDNNAKVTFVEKVVRASSFYREKYGKYPKLCYINLGQYSGLQEQLKKETPLMMSQAAPAEGVNDIVIAGIIIRGVRHVLPFHFLFSNREA